MFLCILYLQPGSANQCQYRTGFMGQKTAQGEVVLDANTKIRPAWSLNYLTVSDGFRAFLSTVFIYLYIYI